MRLADYLRRKGLTQQEFADRAGIRQPDVSRYIRGTVSPSWGHLERIYRATRRAVTPNDFLRDRLARARKSGK